MWIESGTFEPLTAVLEGLGYEPFSSPGDRHGSWEWPFYREGGGITRFVILAATPVERENIVQVELWIGAEADQRFTRDRVECFRWSAEELPHKIEVLIPAIEQAVARANILSCSDLKEERLTLRPHAVSAR